jgi:2-methylcitrate dehydratase PrpD
MQLDTEVDAAYPRRWIGKVIVQCHDGRTLAAQVDEPKGDPGNTMSRSELEEKAIRLAAFREGATESEMRSAMSRLWTIRDAAEVESLLGTSTHAATESFEMREPGNEFGHATELASPLHP